MAVVGFVPKNAPFAPEEIDVLNGVLAKTTPVQRAWLTGFLAGLDAAHGTGAQPLTAPRPRTPLTILYASESGNAESLAFKARKAAQKQGFDVKVLDMADADSALLEKARNILVYASTWGEGDPPQRAADFYAALMSDKAPRLAGVRFAVLALGDTAYADFCATGRAIDARLEALGAERAVPRIDLDLDFGRQAADWTQRTLDKLAPLESQTSATVVHVDFKGPGLNDTETLYTSDSPIDAEITTLVNLSGSGSTRETWHVELSPAASDFTYQPGDAIGVIPENDPGVVNALLEAVGLGGNGDLIRKFVRSYDVTTLSRPLAEHYATLTGRKDLARLKEPQAFAAYASDRQLIDLFEDFPEKLTADQLTGLLRPLPGRLYSVASSPRAHPGEAHILVGAVRWSSHGRQRGGVTSTYFADRRDVGNSVRVYVRPNRHFRLPTDDARPIVMIGAGTGIAPYRGFVAERAEAGAKGRSWLVFGERSFTNDFLYQMEWQDHLKSGALSRLDVAFSRDQPEKIYVQQRLWERRAELLDWLADGAHLYLCGDEKGMARDVDQMLVKILAGEAKGDLEAGRARLKELSKAGRYQRDVY